MNIGSTPREELPSRWKAALFNAKAAVLRLRRSLHDLPHPPPSLPRKPIWRDAAIHAESQTALYSSTVPAEFALQAGKVQNLRLAARALNGLVLPAGQVFSFWANVPRPTRRSGFANGRELREGCVIPSVGGGLCQLSNALHDAALTAGFEIVERHAHTRRLPGSLAEIGRDATVFWNYVDLRFRSRSDIQMEVRLSADQLIVRFRGLSAVAKFLPATVNTPHAVARRAPAESCEVCGVADCFRNASASKLPQTGCIAWLVDAFQPEFDTWMSAQRQTGDCLFIPLRSRRYGIGAYRWSTGGFDALHEAPWTVLKRSLVSRRLAAQGARRQRALLAMDADLAGAFARRLPPLATHLVVSQNLLPFLYNRGDLGGRTFDVFMTRLPLAELHRVLDRAAAAHPQSATLGDFRAPDELLQAETNALAAARHWITPHSAIARLAGARAIHLPWQIPKSAAVTPGEWFVFPASTVGRKGAWELRAVARELDLPVRLAGPCLEGADFWRGVRIEYTQAEWLTGACALVLPAWVEHQPRRLLQAAASGIPVIASEACGIDGVAGVTTIPAGSVTALRDAIFKTQGAFRHEGGSTSTERAASLPGKNGNEEPL